MSNRYSLVQRNNQSPRVLHIITGLKTGGAEMMLYKLLSYQDRTSSKSIVISLLDKGEIGQSIESLEVPVFCLNLSNLLCIPKAIILLLRIVVELKPDIVQGWMYHGNLVALFVALFCSRNAKVLWNIRQSIYSLNHEKWSTKSLIRLSASLSGYPANIIYNSVLGQQHHERIGYAISKSVLIPNGFDTKKFVPSEKNNENVRASLGISHDEVLIGRFGRFHPMKDYFTFLKAANLLLNTLKEHKVYFLLCGHNVDLRNSVLLEIFQKLNLSLNRFFLLGERKDIPELTSALDIATSSSSHGEGFPNILGEAMSCGVPCVATDVGDSAWIIGNTGKAIPPKDPLALACAWQELIEQGKQGRSKLGHLARERVLQNFSLDLIVSQYDALYASLTQS